MKIKIISKIVFLFLLMSGEVHAQLSKNSGVEGASTFESQSKIDSSQMYFTNPIRPYGADPWVIQTDGKYYFSESNGISLIVVHEFDKLSDLARPTKSQRVYDSSTTGIKLGDLWGPHINKINGEWYIYFCAHTTDHEGLSYQRMWVLKSTTDSPFGPYRNMGEVLNSNNRDWAIDGSVLQRANGDLYFVWSGISKVDIANDSYIQRTYIAKMLSPTRIDRSTITVISSPTNRWEKFGAPIQEGQRPLYIDKDGKSIIMYSASFSGTDDYCLGSLTNVDGDFLNPESWKKSSKPVFRKTDKVFGPGGASYVKSPDGKENWIIYHAAQKKGSGWARNIRMQKFTFDENNNPVFGKPIAPGVQIPVPSGDYVPTGIGYLSSDAQESADSPVYELSGKQIKTVLKGGVYIQGGKKKIMK